MPKQPGEPTDRRDSEPELPPGMSWGWFCGEGNETEGIKRVIFSDELYEIDGGRFGKDMEEWKHHTGNQGAKDSSEIKTAGLRKILQEIEGYIFSKTGFTPRELLDQTTTLAVYYEGHRQAPFEVELKLTPQEAIEEENQSKRKLLEKLIFSGELLVPLSFFVLITKDGIVIDIDYSDDLVETIGKENLEQAISVVIQSSIGLKGEALKAYNDRLKPIDQLFKDRIGHTFSDLIRKMGIIERMLRGKKIDILPEEIKIKTED